MNLRSVIIISLLVALFVFILVGLGNALFPLFASVFLAYVFFPVIKKIEDRGIKRVYVVSGVFIFVSLFVIVLFVLGIPILISEARGFISEIPKTILYLAERVEFFSKSFGFEIKLDQYFLQDIFQFDMGNVSESLLSTVSGSLTGVLSGVFSWVMFVLNLLLIPLFFFYVILDYERLVKEVKSLVPLRIHSQMSRYVKISNEVLSVYFRGQLLVAGILALMYGFGLWIIGLKFGLFIGVLTGLISLIPYAGFSIGFITALLFGLAQYSSFFLIAGIVAVFVFVQTIESFFITPYLVGEKVGLKAFTTILVLIIGGNLLGLLGMLIAIPVAAIGMHFFKDLKQEYQNTEFFLKKF